MTQQLFADYIGQSPATLSSIFNGRTKPTLNIVEAIKKKIPDISTDWLMFGSGSMYLDSNASTTSAAGSPTLSNGPNMVAEPVFDFSDNPSMGSDESYRMREIRGSSSTVFNGVKSTPSNPRYETIKIIDNPPRRVTEIRVFYDDQTWDSFVPAKK